MPSKHPYLWMAAIGAICAGLVGHELRQRQDIDALVDPARRWLRAPLSRAPELQDVDAARAGAFLDGALAIREQDAVRGRWHYAHALGHYQRGQFDRANERLEQASALLGEDADALVLRAALAMEHAQPKPARRALTRALSLHPHHPRALMLLSDLALDAGEGEAARDYAGDAVRRDPKAASALNRRGLAHELLGDLAAAAEDFRAAAELHDRLPHAHLNLGRLLRQQGQTRPALLAFAEAARRAPQRPEAWLGAGLCRAELGDTVGARIDLEHARTARSDAPEPLLALADLDMAAGQRAEAITRYRAALTLEPGLAAGWVKLGNALVRDGQAGEARAAFERAITADPELAAAHNGRGAVLSMLGEDSLAAEALAEAARLDAHDPNPLLNLARLRLRIGDREGAERAQQQAMALDPAVAPLPTR